MIKSYQPKSTEHGSVLLLTLFLAGALSLLASSFTYSTRTGVERSRVETLELYAEMAAHSALQYTLRQLNTDKNWPGTEGRAIELDEDSYFQVDREPDPGTGNVVYTLTGAHGAAQKLLEVTIRPQQADPLREQALAMLGGAADLMQVDIDGNLLVADQPGWVYDYIPDPADPEGGEWVEGGPDEIEYMNFDHTLITGQLNKYDPDTTYTENYERTLTVPVAAPAWHLDQFLEPGPDRQIFHNVTDMSNVTLDETAVFVLDPGVQLTLRDVNFYGGAVVYVEPTYDTRSGPRNEVYLKKHNVFGGGDEGVHPNIGLVAPASTMRSPGTNGHPPELNGLVYVNEVDVAMGGVVNGQFIVLNKVWQLHHFVINYDEYVANNPPAGVRYATSSHPMQILQIREMYEGIEVEEPEPIL